MAANCSFHPEALFEYAAATQYYLDEASPRVVEVFVTSIEFAIAALVATPGCWPVVEAPEVRRYVFSGGSQRDRRESNRVGVKVSGQRLGGVGRMGVGSE